MEDLDQNNAQVNYVSAFCVASFLVLGLFYGTTGSNTVLATEDVVQMTDLDLLSRYVLMPGTASTFLRSF